MTVIHDIHKLHFIFFFFFFLFCLQNGLVVATSPQTTHSSFSCFSASSPIFCSPLFSTISFPFGASVGCGHPSFQIHCSSNRSFISIANTTFSIAATTSNSLLLSLPLNTTHHKINCPHTLLPHQIDVSHTPFRISNHTCSKLAHLPHLCPTSNLTASHCALAHSHSRLLQKPLTLLPDCVSGATDALACDPNSSLLLNSVVQFLRQGIEMQWNLTNDPYFFLCERCRKAKSGLCGYNDSEPGKPFVCFINSQEADHDRVGVFSALFAVACASLLSAVAVTIFRCRGWTSGAAAEEDPTALFLHRHRSSHLLPPVFTYEELESATNRFDPKRKIGDGGFGSVYLAQLPDGQILAVKRLHRRHHAMAAVASKSFCNEVLILSSISHPNLVRLHGYCSDHRGLILVYDYVPNGTLAHHLHGEKKFLTWRVRLEVALQTAMAMEYLHFGVDPAIVHRDITSSNIFVERDMRVKLGDFGLSRLLVFAEPSATYVWTGPQGTPGYLDPDYHRSFQLTEKSDVYSFGVVLLELISGMKAVDLKRDKRDVALADLVVGKIQAGQLRQVLDPVLQVEGDEVMATVNAVAELGFRCVAVDKDDRPNSREVVAELRRIWGNLRGSTTALQSAADSCKSGR